VSDSKDAIARVLARHVASGAMPGAQWWVGGPDGPVSQGAIGTDATQATPYDLASLTKPLATALLAVILEREGRLSLGATLGATFTELRATPYGTATMRDAAFHRAGFPAWKALYLEGTTREDYVASIAATAPAGPIGGTVYSDLGYLLLGFAIEHSVYERCQAKRPASLPVPQAIGRVVAMTDHRFIDRAGRIGHGSREKFEECYSEAK